MPLNEEQKLHLVEKHMKDAEFTSSASTRHGHVVPAKSVRNPLIAEIVLRVYADGALGISGEVPRDGRALQLIKAAVALFNRDVQRAQDISGGRTLSPGVLQHMVGNN